MISLPFWPEEIRAMWRGQGVVTAPAPAIDLQAVRADAAAVANAAVETSRRELTARIDDLEKRVRALSATAAEASRPAAPSDADKARIEQETRMLAAAWCPQTRRGRVEGHRRSEKGGPGRHAAAAGIAQLRQGHRGPAP